jgi:2-dehydropantoate 2-reductase
VEIVSHPKWVGSNSDKLPQLDYLLCCTKSYDLEASLNQFKDSISNQTVIIPFQNGVNSRDLIKKLFPNNYVADGCVYIVSEVIRPGVIEQKGDVHSFYFGHTSIPEILLKNLENILQKAGIDAHYSSIIEEIIWEKFIFISSVASLTTFLEKNIGQIRESEADFRTLNALVDEAVSVAIAAGIKISPYTQTKTLKKIKEMPADSKSSMQRDFENKKQTEYQSLTKYMVEVGRNYGMATPEFDKILAWFESLNSKSK